MDSKIRDLTTRKAWTVDLVREILPPVEVKGQNGRIVRGRVVGRRNDWASVYVGSMEDTRSAEFAWSTIASALNSGRALLVY